MLRDLDTGDFNAVYFMSTKSKRVCRSVLAADLFVMIDGVGIGYSIRDAIQR